MWIVGPSRPATRPDERPSTPPTNFTGSTRRQRTSRRPSSAPSTSGTPLPEASGAMRWVSRNASVTPTAAMPAAAAIMSGPGPIRSMSQVGQRSKASTVKWKAPPTIPVTKPQMPATQ